MTESWFESIRSLCKSCESFEVKVIDLKTDNEQFTRLVTEFEAQTKNLREVNATLKSELSIKNENYIPGRYLTRHIARNINRVNLIEDIIEDIFKGITEKNVATGKRVIKRARRKLPTEPD